MKYKRKLIHTATVWQNPVSDNYGGFTYDAPKTISCRWQDKNQLFIDNTGREAVSRSIIWLDVDDAVKESEMIAFGDKKSFTVPYTCPDAWVIKSIDRTSNLKGNQTAVTAYI
jgi:hypothetical protein